MKIIAPAAVLAALTAAALPLRPEFTGTLLLAAALGLLMAQDYSARRSLRFETGAPTAAQFTARFFFHRRPAAPRAAFRAPALSGEPHRLAA
jgi:hypothetical protein